MKQESVTRSGVHLPLDRYPQIELGVTPAAVTPKCIMCGLKISPRSKTCSVNCRKAMSRRKEAIKREVDVVKDALWNLNRFSERWPDLLQEIDKAAREVSIAARGLSFDMAGKVGTMARDTAGQQR